MTNFTFDELSPVAAVAFTLGWFAFAGLLFLIAYRARSGWVKATMAAFALSILGLQILAVLPSWWLFYSESRLDMGGQGCVELDMACLKQVAKDTVVVIQNAVALGGFVVAFLIYQKRFPSQLAAGEAKPEATGGYK